MKARRSPEQRRIVVEQIEAWLREHPGATYTELALGIGIHTEDARKLTTRRVRHLVTDLESEIKNRGGYQTIWTNDKILQALREAAGGSEMLSGGHYADLVAEGAVQGPTLPRVMMSHGHQPQDRDLQTPVCPLPLNQPSGPSAGKTSGDQPKNRGTSVCPRPPAG